MSPRARAVPEVVAEEAVVVAVAEAVPVPVPVALAPVQEVDGKEFLWISKPDGCTVC